jgi:hypothetical protein
MQQEPQEFVPAARVPPQKKVFVPPPFLEPKSKAVAKPKVANSIPLGDPDGGLGPKPTVAKLFDRAVFNF